ncbi:MAG TPA: hypothetical protein EYQ28_15475, partial [Henriciella sp.]|nr:hypothetical protein [Henriciella sp.]
MNLADYNKVYTALQSSHNYFKSVDDLIKECNINCYDAMRQAICDYNYNRLLIKEGEEESFRPPDEWLIRGIYIGLILSKRNPGWLKDFVQENNDILSTFDVVKFIGSGQIGDAWELQDNKILKIFDNSTQNDLAKYEQAKDIIDNEKDPSKYNIRVFDIGTLKVPEKYKGLKTPALPMARVKNEDKPEYEPAYVVLEKLTTYDGLVKSYLGDEGSMKELPEALKKSGLPEDTHFQRALGFNPEPDFVVELFMTYIGDVIIQGAIREWYVQAMEHYSAGNIDNYGRPITLDDELRNRTGEFFFSRNQKIKELTKMFIEQLPKNKGLPEPKFLEAYTAILKLVKPDLP